MTISFLFGVYIGQTKNLPPVENLAYIAYYKALDKMREIEQDVKNKRDKSDE